MTDVLICEMSPRDGLQFLGGGASPRVVPVERKLALCEALARAGLPFIEAGSFVSDRVAQMKDTDELCRRLSEFRTTVPNVQWAALVPNMKHYPRFAACGFDTCALFVSASEKYSQKNVGMPLEEAMSAAGEVASAARIDGKRLRAHLSAAFQEMYTEVTPSDLPLVLRLTGRLLEMGCEHVSLADTDGAAQPGRVRAVIAAAVREFGATRVAVHLHDRYGQALANALAALEAGARLFDASVGGIGGTPAAKSASQRTMAGNLSTEDLAWMLEGMGFKTGVDFERLLDAGRQVYAITQYTGDSAPNSRWLRERLGATIEWRTDE